MPSNGRHALSSAAQACLVLSAAVVTSAAAHLAGAARPGDDVQGRDWSAPHHRQLAHQAGRRAGHGRVHQALQAAAGGEQIARERGENE